MSEDVFDPKDPRNVIDKHGVFEVLIMFAWANGDSIPSAAYIDVSNPDRSSHLTAKSLKSPWMSYEDAVTKTKNYGKLFADDLSVMKPA